MMQKKENNNKKSNPYLSIIIPAYKAEKFIAGNLETVINVLDQIRYSYEVIVVVDGSVDRTFQAAEKVAKYHKNKIKVVGYQDNMGKGHAVRFGMAKARGNIVGFIDANDLDPNGISMLLEHFEWYNADIIIGSKRHPVSKVYYPWQRRIISFGYQIIVRVLFNLKVKDTQTGIKFFRKEVLEAVMPRLLVKAFAFDIEMLSVAYYLGYTRIYEAPVNLKMEFKGGLSTIVSKGFIKTAFSMFWDTIAVFYRLKIIHFYDNSNKKNWITPDYLTLSK